MSKRLSQDQLAELTNLRNRSNLILDFLAEKIGNVPVISKFKQLVAREFETKRLRGLRIVSKDISSWGKQLSPADLLELEHRLQSQLGVDIEKDKATAIEHVHRIMNRGKITDASEYQLLLERVEEIYEDPSQSEEVEALNRLLADYHREKGHK